MKRAIVAVRLEEIMEMRGLNQGQVEAFSGIGQQNISKMINKGSEPKASTIIALARGLGVSADYLLGLPERDPAKLAPDEEALVAAYRALDEAHRKVVLGLARGLGGSK